MMPFMQDVGAKILCDALDPWDELRRMQRSIGRQRQTADLLVMVVIVRFGEKSRLELEDAIEIEGAAAEHLAQIDAAALGPMHVGIGIDPANARFDRGELAVRAEIG